MYWMTKCRAWQLIIHSSAPPTFPHRRLSINVFRFVPFQDTLIFMNPLTLVNPPSRYSTQTPPSVPLHSHSSIGCTIAWCENQFPQLHVRLYLVFWRQQPNHQWNWTSFSPSQMIKKIALCASSHTAPAAVLSRRDCDAAFFMQWVMDAGEI